MNQQELPSVLCVDDEPRVVEGLALHLRRNYQVLTANGAQSALEILKDKGAPAVIVSDMRMPGIDGATLLKRVKDLYPDMTRILLTGEPGRDAAMAAVNEGQIFRFLTKPCPPDRLLAAIEAGVVHHRLVVAERVLLQETLIGCIKALVDILAITNPIAFGRATRVQRLATQLAEAIGAKGFWQLEAAAMLSQIGFVALPVELVEKLYYGKRLTPAERGLADGAAQTAQKLLGHIPRLEPVMEILTASGQSKIEMPEGSTRLGAGILRLVLEYDAQIVQGQSADAAIKTITAQANRHEQKLVESFTALTIGAANTEEISQMTLGRLKPGMVIMDDLRTQVGTLLVPKGFEVTETFLERMRNFGSGILSETVRVSASKRNP